MTSMYLEKHRRSEEEYQRDLVIAHNVFLSRHEYIPVKDDEHDQARFDLIMRFLNDLRRAGYTVT